METRAFFILAMATTSLACAQTTTIFTDDFATSSLNPAMYPIPTATSTGYEVASTKAAGASLSGGGGLNFGMPATNSGLVEAQAWFSSTPISLTSPGQF